jgi:hypothetical protein
MKIEVNIEKKYAVLLLAFAFVLAGVFVVYAVAVDTSVNHGPDQIDWNKPINGPLLFNTGASPAYNVWIQGSGPGVGGNTRNAALVGEVSNDRLYLNYLGEYTGGTWIDGDTRIRKDLQVDGDFNGKKQPLQIKLFEPDQTTWKCSTVNVQEHCGDDDGCTMRVGNQNEIEGIDQVLVTGATIYMEQADQSSNLHSSTAGRTLVHGGGDYNWFTGSTNLKIIFSAWGSSHIYNYVPASCRSGGNSPTHSDPYDFTFVSHPNHGTNFIIYD